MNLVLITSIFNVFIFVFILIIWITFVRNLIRTLRQGQRGGASSRSRDTQRNQWDRANPQTVRQVHVDNASQSRRNRNSQSQKQAQQNGQTWQDLLKRDPKELYQLLRENLPDSYESEIKAIFNSDRPMMNLVKFLRRKDVWPILQSLPTRLSSPQKTDAQLIQPKTVQKMSVAVEQDDEDYDYNTMFVEMDEDANNLNQEIDDFVKEFDGFSDSFDNMFPEISTSEPEVRATRHLRNNENANINQKINRKWLRDAVIASMILERPEQ